MNDEDKKKRDAILRKSSPGQKDRLPESLITEDEPGIIAAHEPDESPLVTPPPREGHRRFSLFRWFHRGA